MPDLDVVLVGVNKTFEGGVRAVIDFNAEIEHGEFVSMLGPSGCGKTTTLRMIGGLEEVTSGKIYITGTDVTDLPPSERDTSMMFQSFALFPHRNVHQNVEFSLKVKGIERRERDRQVGQMLELVSLDPLADRYPRDLSGGQQQRVALARALISKPTLLLLDEPLGALDYSLRQQMMVELKTIQRELGITFIMVTHSQQEAMSLADKVVVMSDAVIQQIGTSREVYEAPRTRFVADFIGNNNVFEGTIRSQSGSIVFVESKDHLFYVRAPNGDERDIRNGRAAHFLGPRRSHAHRRPFRHGEPGRGPLCRDRIPGFPRDGRVRVLLRDVHPRGTAPQRFRSCLRSRGTRDDLLARGGRRPPARLSVR